MKPTALSINDLVKTGFQVRRELDPAMMYPAGINVSNDELAAVDIVQHDFHGEWNYMIAAKAGTLRQ